MNLWHKVQKFPPVLVRLLARKPCGTAMSDIDIVNRSGGRLLLADVRRLGYLTSWDDVSVRNLRDFTYACRVDIADPAQLKNLNRYVKNPKFGHLQRHADWVQFREMLRVYAESLLHNKR